MSLSSEGGALGGGIPWREVLVPFSVNHATTDDR
jgi:hypothetical protein